MFQEGYRDSQPPQLRTGWPVNPRASSTAPHVAFLLPFIFFWLSWVFWKCVSDGSLGKRGQWRKSRTQKRRNVGARSPHGPTEAEGGHCGGGCGDPGCPAGFSEAQGPPRASGLQDFPGFSAQMNRLGESLRATRPRLLHVLGTITRVCDSETLRMGQWVPPSIGPPTSQGQGPLRLSSRREP